MNKFFEISKDSPIIIDTCIFMVGIEKRQTNPKYSLENMKKNWMNDAPYLHLFNNDNSFKESVKRKLWEIDPQGKHKPGVLKRNFTKKLEKNMSRKKKLLYRIIFF